MSRSLRVLRKILGPPLDPDQLRDPDEDLLELAMPLLGLLERYFRAEIHGVDNIPQGPALIVGNHNAGITFMEPFLFGKRYHQQRGGQMDIHGLGHDALWKIPGLNNLLMMLGGVRASHDNAARIFADGRKVAVWPGGNYESFRPWSQRHRVDLGGHKGFVRLAFRHGVDIVPLMSLGGHEAFFVLRRGQRLARDEDAALAQLDRLALVIDDIKVPAHRALRGRARLDRQGLDAHVVRQDGPAAFGLPVVVDYGHADVVGGPLPGGLVQGFTGEKEVAQR